MNDRSPWTDPSWIRGMTQRRMSRRDLIRNAAVGAGAIGISSILAACGVSGEAQTTGPTAGEEGSAQWWADMKAQGPGAVSYTHLTLPTIYSV